jgi:lipopolysaccharide transport system permease protein
MLGRNRGSSVNIEIRSTTTDQGEWTQILTPRRSWLSFDAAEIWQYRDLVLLLVRRDFVAVYKQTILGPLWFLLQPLFTALVFTVIFGKVARIPTDGIPPILFYMSGTVVWNYFAACLTGTSSTFVTNAALFGKVYFPRLVVPITTVISTLTSFAIQLGMLLCFIWYFQIKGAPVSMTATIAILPLLVAQMAALGLGCGILVSALTTRYRDLTHLVSFGVQLWMFATPVVYPTSQLPPQWQWLMTWNPMAPVVEAFRQAFIIGGRLPVKALCVSGLLTGAVLCAGIALFSHVEKSFTDIV